MSDGEIGGESIFVSAQDALRLHVRAYGERTAPRLPVVCLPGLSRTGADFDPLARALACDPAHPRFVATLDYRGRGRSEHDRDPGNYSFTVELSDILAVLTALEIGRAAFVGTSRGGLLTMLLGSARPTALAAVILNDIGPVIEPQGLMRIKSYVGKLPQPENHGEGAKILRRVFGAQFPKLVDEDWERAARLVWEQREGRLITTYDPRLADPLARVELERPLPPLWNEFDSLARVPLMLIRGANSDILSPATVAAMRARRPDLEFVEVPDQGHPPLLREPEVVARIAAFIAAAELA